jgi:hypothetical protein
VPNECPACDFAEVVWKASLRLGCGYKLCPGPWHYVVCRYDPPGNKAGQHKANVLKP